MKKGLNDRERLNLALSAPGANRYGVKQGQVWEERRKRAKNEQGQFPLFEVEGITLDKHGQLVAFGTRSHTSYTTSVRLDRFNTQNQFYKVRD